MCAIMEEYARHFFQNGVSLEIVKASIPNLSEKELLEIYHAVQE